MRRFVLCAAAACAPFLGCGSDSTGLSESPVSGDASPDAHDGATADAPPEAATHDATAMDGRADGAPDAAMGEAGVASADAGAVCTGYDAGAAPDGSGVCGDGWRNASTEECDDGLRDASARQRGCSASCQVLDELAVVTLGSDGGLANTPRTVGLGRHTVSVSDSQLGIAYFEPASSPLALSLATFSPKAVPLGAPTRFTAQSTVVQQSNPVVAGLPCGRFAVAWGDFGGDGDELGIALGVLTPGVAPAGPPTFANTTTAFSQHDPDILWTGTQLIVAWVDESNIATAPDIRFQTFDATGNPLATGDQTLAATADVEADVALAPFAGSWAAAWRDDVNGLETVQVQAGSTTWTIGPAFLPPPDASKPALAQLDATHLLVAYAVGVSVGGAADAGDAGGVDAGSRDAGADAGRTDGGADAGSGVPVTSQVMFAILSTGAPGNVTGTVVVPTVPTAVGLSQSQPNVVSVAGGAMLAWWSAAALGDPNGEELWTKPVAWNGTTLTTSVAEAPLPRWPQARVGDQRNPAMAASPLLPTGSLLVAWDDLGRDVATGEGTGDVVFQLAPLPLLRTPGDGGP